MKTSFRTYLKKAATSLGIHIPGYDDRAIFPQAGTAQASILFRLWKVKDELKNRSVAYNLGALYTLPHAFPAFGFFYLIHQNPNHLGNWSAVPPHEDTKQLEYEVIRQMITLYRARPENFEGYITSGATEGNLFSVWVGRKYLEQYSSLMNICLLHTSLTHYSVNKAADICNIQQRIIPIDKDRWSVHAQGLEDNIARLYKRGMRGFMIPITHGYTGTGTSDSVRDITPHLHALRKKYKNIHFFLWVDAAFNGLVAPFVSRNYAPLASPYIHTYIVDFHKFGRTPYASGVVIYKKSLRKFIEKSVDYLQEKDSTILGSRGGISAAGIWTSIRFFGKKGFSDMILRQMENKNYCIASLTALLPGTQIITDPGSLTCGIIFRTLINQRLPVSVESKYWLYPGKTQILFYPDVKEKVVLYKLFFLPHMKRRVIEEFLRDISIVKT